MNTGGKGSGKMATLENFTHGKFCLLACSYNKIMREHSTLVKWLFPGSGWHRSRALFLLLLCLWLNKQKNCYSCCGCDCNVYCVPFLTQKHPAFSKWLIYYNFSWKSVYLSQFPVYLRTLHISTCCPGDIQVNWRKYIYSFISPFRCNQL
jgi:hypothetical protein